MILEIKDIVKYFNGFCALMNVKLEVEENRLHAIIGPNGAGKTTLFNLISGIYDVSEGQIAFRKKPINGLKPHQRAELGISRTFQIVRLFGHMSVLENVMLGSHCKTRTGLLKTLFRVSLRELEEEKTTRENAMRWLEFVGIAHKADQIAVNLPHAEQRLVEIARALNQDPDLLLFDEPAAGMNPKETLDLESLIVKINQMGKTVLLIEHNMDLVMEISHVISVLNFGAKIAEGKPSEIQENPVVIEAYLGRKR